MSAVAARAWFVRPRVRESARGFAPRALVLGTEADAPALAAALAGELRAGRGGAAALVICTREPSPVLALAATPAARSVAARLAEDGLAAVARGRLAWATPDVAGAGSRKALDAVIRAASAADAPVVVAVCGPRPAEVDELLEEFDLIVLTDDGLGAAHFAAAQLEGAGVGALVAAAPRDAARLLALAGWGRLRGGEVAAVAAELA